MPGKSLVVYDPARGVVSDVFPWEDGHAQERSLFAAVLGTVQAGDLWIADRNFCTREFLCDLDARGAGFIIRQRQGFPFEMVTSFRPLGRVETGKLAEQWVEVVDAQGGVHVFRRLRLQLDHATRDGATVLYILTNIPARRVSAKRVARLYRKRWTLETAFQIALCHCSFQRVASRSKTCPTKQVRHKLYIRECHISSSLQHTPFH